MSKVQMKAGMSNAKGIQNVQSQKSAASNKTGQQTDRSGKTAAVNPRKKPPGGNDPRKKKEPPELTELKIQIVNMKSQVLDLENSIRQQHDELENYKTENVDLNKQMTQFVMEKAGKSRDSVIVDLNQQVEKLQKQIECIGKEKTEIQADKELYMTTLSKYITEKTPDEMPDIPNMEENIRPTKIADMFNQVYQNVWPRAYEIANEKLNDEKLSCIYLLTIFKDSWEFCCALSRHQLHILEMTYLVPYGPNMSVDATFNIPQLSVKNLKVVKETRKHIAKQTIGNLYGLFMSPESGTGTKDIPSELEPYVRSCLEVCWYSAIQDPPLGFVFDTGVSWELDTNYFEMFTKTGIYVDFIVWPAMLLHNHGVVLQKGVVQALDEKSHRPQQ
ncbi:Hypothetical predicted protein [Mytilus galloprovincialis]|uniref:Mitochondria-eating protein C-terminal domain-containing protein n=1 Tax=Mytilus galloprovincialis TaxID=29158 RepID=A0A8B6EIE4_MYTGA|nr:Hypothetical predicted protein [Mytilus galloprovincialis]